MSHHCIVVIGFLLQFSAHTRESQSALCDNCFLCTYSLLCTLRAFWWLFKLYINHCYSSISIKTDCCNTIAMANLFYALQKPTGGAAAKRVVVRGWWPPAKNGASVGCSFAGQENTHHFEHFWTSKRSEGPRVGEEWNRYEERMSKCYPIKGCNLEAKAEQNFHVEEAVNNLFSIIL